MEINASNIIISGGLKGFGKAIVEKLKTENTNIGIFDISDSENFCESENIKLYKCDVSNFKEVENYVNEFYNKFGKIDILINNAGIIRNSPLIKFTSLGLEKHTPELWEKVISVNLTSVFNMTVNVVEKMFLKRTKGLIINLSSISASGNPGQSAYSAAKAGVNSLTASWSKELGFLGIRVAGISPGFFQTDSTKNALSESTIKEIKKNIPLKRLGLVNEVVNGILFIIKNDYFNGKILEIDGGLTI